MNVKIEVFNDHFALRACAELGRPCYGFEIKKNFVKDAKEKMLSAVQPELF